jgi:hypothetical protein
MMVSKIETFVFTSVMVMAVVVLVLDIMVWRA